MNQPTSALKTSQESINGVTIVMPEGRLDFGAASEFQAVLEAALGSTPKPRGLIVDCSGLAYVSSAGLRSFLVGARSAKSAGAVFLVCSLSPSVREVFTVSGFSRLIEDFPDRTAALAKVG